MPVWLWIVLSVASDRAHSWVTIYRVYFDFDEFKKNAKLFLILPFLCWVGGVVAYKIDSSVFWRCIAYFAVYHQVRQNYGFFAIYSRQEKFEKNWMMSFDRFVLYFVAFFPFLYWHLHPRTYTMFEGVEFVLFPTHHLDVILFSLFFGSLAFFLGKEVYLYKKRGKFNVPKNVLLLGTGQVRYR